MSSPSAAFPFDAHTHAGSGELVLAPEVIDSLIELGDGPDLVLELVELYVEDAIKRVDSVMVGARDGDMAVSNSAAHALKSASANMGAVQFSEVCRQIEDAAKAGDSSVVGGLADQFLLMYEEVQHALGLLTQSLCSDEA